MTCDEKESMIELLDKIIDKFYKIGFDCGYEKREITEKEKDKAFNWVMVEFNTRSKITE